MKDSFTSPEYVRYALKGALAVMVCYDLQSAVDWPGIRTCIVTCLIVGLGSEGATIQKGSLRIAGALVGAAMGFAAILFLISQMESITSLALLVAAGTAVAAWVVVGSPRIAYVGVQIAFAFYACVIQGLEPTWHFATIATPLVGICSATRHHAGLPLRQAGPRVGQSGRASAPPFARWRGWPPSQAGPPGRDTAPASAP